MRASAPCRSESASSDLSGCSNEGRNLVDAHPFAIYKDRHENTPSDVRKHWTRSAFCADREKVWPAKASPKST